MYQLVKNENLYLIKHEDIEYGMSVIELEAISISKENVNCFDKIIQLISEFGNDSNASLELKFMSNDNSLINIYIILRINLNSSTNNVLTHKTNTLVELLQSQGINSKAIKSKEFIDLLEDYNKNKDAVLFKYPCIEDSNTPITSFYYSVERTLGINSLDLFKLIIQSVRNIPFSAIGISLIPYHFSPNESNLINQLSSTLVQIVNGVPDSYYGNISDYAANKHFQNYQTLSKSFANFNMIIHVSSPNVNSIANNLISYLNQANRWDYFTFPFEEDSYFINYPHVLLNYKRDHLQDWRFWRMEEAPSSLFDLQFVYTFDEVLQFFNIPCLADDTIKGIKTIQNIQLSGNINSKVLSEDNIKVGTINNGSVVGLSKKDLMKHIFVSGVPGQGKTVFLQSLLYQLNQENIPFLVIEPAKKEYRTLKNLIPNLQIFTPGNNECIPFVINPFIPPKGVTLGAYKSSLIQALEVAFDMETTLKRLFREAINNCYMKHGWRDTSTSDDPVTKFGIFELLLEFDSLMKNKYDRETRERISTAGSMRIKNMIETDPILFDTIQSITVDELLSNPCVIELNAIEDDELKNLIMALLLSSMFAYTSTIEHKNYGQLNQLLLLEEAHVLLKKKSLDGSSLAQKMISRILTEKRASGFAIAIADQSPENVTSDVVKQTGSKICFRTVHGNDRDILGTAMVMNEDELQHLARLTPGEAFFYNENLNRPILIKTDNFREIHQIPETISDEQCHAQSDYWKTHAEKSMPYNECAFIPTCSEGCNYRIRSEALYLANRYYMDYCSAPNISQAELMSLLKKVEPMMQHYMGEYPSKRRIINCAKCQLLRKIYLEKNLGMHLSNRIKLMKNRSFIKE